METQTLITELRNALQATVFIDKINTDGSTSKITVLLVDDVEQRKVLIAKYVTALNSIAITQ